MIYKINFMSEEVDDFKLSFEASSEATFLDLHKAILAAVGYPDDQMTSFFMCNDQWEKGQEVTLVEMGDSFEYDNMTMEQTHLNELLFEQKQRMLYVFDPMYDRCFFGSLSKITPGEMEGVKLIDKKIRLKYITRACAKACPVFCFQGPKRENKPNERRTKCLHLTS